MTIPSYQLVQTAPPAALPVTLADMKLSLRITHAEEDDFLTGLIETATELCEAATGLSLITRSYSLYLDRWPGASLDGWWDGMREGVHMEGNSTTLHLPKGPLQAIQQINLFDENDVAAVYPAGSYLADARGLPGRVLLKENAVAPSAARAASGIEIQFTAGYGAAPADIPAALRQGIRQIVAHLYERRGDDAETTLSACGAAALFKPFNRMSVL